MNERLRKFPFILVFFAYLGYLGYEFYGFHHSDEGSLNQQKKRQGVLMKELDDVKKKLAEGQNFMKSLDAKKTEMRAEAKKLDDYHGMLVDSPDVASVIKLLITEARKVDLRVNKIEPGKKNQKEYYFEQEYRLDLKGTFHQLTLFIQRVSQLQRILKVRNFKLKPVVGYGKASRMIASDLTVSTYQYASGKEDKLISATLPTGGVHK